MWRERERESIAHALCFAGPDPSYLGFLPSVCRLQSEVAQSQVHGHRGVAHVEDGNRRLSCGQVCGPSNDVAVA